MTQQPVNDVGDPICPCCEMPIVDDYYRAGDGEEWHQECWNQPPEDTAEELPGGVCDLCGKEVWRERDGVLLCGPCWNVALAREAGHA
ncbi:hypothetical protein IRT45_35200 [Nocardia sp. BSTN01]|uniref:hypothetical protein n=1 Tax=Nocardia sp. BSTN01 TaxID=2783665 RepID=UPI00188F571F|nr:hypothetical protein [Nocardia sp. BSTN01]MBF5002366.1 hypothetical protein [Nocardia sp. BSTN01]